MRGRPPALNPPTPVDAHIAEQIRTRRLAAKLTQSALGEALGVTFQQIQKYENASNRVSAARLLDLASTLGCEVRDFFPKAEHGEPSALVEAPTRVPTDSPPLASMYEQLSAPSRSIVARLIRILHAQEQG